MISLAAVGEFLLSLAPEHAHAAIAIPDERKGEQVVLFTTHPDINRQFLATSAREVGIAEIFLPRQVYIIDQIPLLGSGKVDYVTLTGMARSATAGS